MKSLFVLLALTVLFFPTIFSINASAAQIDVLDVTSVKFFNSAGIEIPASVVKTNETITIQVTVQNISSTAASTSVEFYDSTGTIWTINQPAAEGTQSISASGTFDFTTTLTINSPLKEGENYTIYAKASSAVGENVLGNNSGFAVLSVISPGGAIPIPETSIFIIPVMLLGVLYFVWKDDKHEQPQTE